MGEREGRIELLRCVLMLCIVFWHCSICCLSGDVRVSKLLACLPIFSVDAFILISGWYGVAFSWRKVRHLIWLGLYSAIVVWLLSAVVTENIFFRYSLGWFGLSYLGLLALSPIINFGLERVVMLPDGGKRLWLSYSALIFLSWLPLGRIGVDLSISGFGGQNLSTMVYVYVTGRMLKEWRVGEGLRTRILLFGFIGLSIINIALAICSGLTQKDVWLNSLFAGWRVNDSPLVIAMAIAFFLLFRKLSVPVSLAKWACFLAPSLFSVYLIHCGVNFDLTRGLISKYLFLPVGGVIWQIVATILATLATFILCALIDFVRRAIDSFVVRIFNVN